MKFKLKIFKDKKIIPIDQFIYKSLYDDQYGFYMKKNPFGSKGDFITSPGISILFSEMIAIWCIAFWKKLGKPKKINILEMGPGDGNLSLDLFNTFKNFKEFQSSYRMILYEKSKYLINIQKKKLNSSNVKWINNLNQIDNSPTIIIANEFFDALPIKQYIFKKDKWHERYVKLLESKEIVICDKLTKLPDFKKICNVNIQKNQKFIEFSKYAYSYLKKISNIIKKNNGGLLCFDYGYKNKKMFNSLQSVKSHSFSSILLNPGKNDITYLLNFSILSKILKKLNLNVANINTQGNFLKKMGIIERANILASNNTFNYKANIFYRVKKLIHPKEMGNLFKVLFVQKKGLSFKLGFEK